VSWGEPPRSYNVWAYRPEQSGADLVAQARGLAEAKINAIAHARRNPDQEVVLLEPQWTLEQHEWQFIVVRARGDDDENYYEVVSH
jgi:hypothetical protein